MSSPLDDLLHRARQGDPTAEKEMYQYLFVRFARIAKRTVGSDQEAEDIAQAACLTVLDKYKTCNFEKGMAAWAYGVLKMKIGNYLQSARVKLEVTAEGLHDGSSVLAAVAPDNPHLRASLLECLKLLIKENQRYARVLNLRYHGYETEEICRRLEITRSNLYTITSRSRDALRECLEGRRH